jgi:hypothetical protein
MEMGLMTIASPSQMVRQTRNSSTYRNRNSYNCSQQSRDVHIGLSKPVKTFSRDGHWNLEKQ